MKKNIHKIVNGMKISNEIVPNIVYTDDLKNIKYIGPISGLAKIINIMCKMIDSNKLSDSWLCNNCGSQLEDLGDIRICNKCGNIHDDQGNEY